LKKKILISGIALVLLGALVMPTTAFADTEGTVDATVTASLVSVSITSDGTVAYGILAIGATQNTTASGLVDTQTATNDGTEIANFNIKSSGAAGGTPWTLAASTGSINEFTHTASIDSGVTWDIAMTTADSYVALATGIEAAGTQDFDLRIEMPSSVTDFTEHTITVTILAVDGS